MPSFSQIVLVGSAIGSVATTWALAQTPLRPQVADIAEAAFAVPPLVDGDTTRLTQRLREGTKITDQLGQFKLSGDRAQFIAADGSFKMPALENLCLERVARAVTDNPSQLDWVVSGTVTEYRGGNYLLVSHAVIKNRTDAVRPAP